MSDVSNTKRRFGIAFGAIGILAVVTVSASDATARSRLTVQPRGIADVTAFDGRWSIIMETNRGACDRSYRVGLDIVNGVVTYEGSPYGRVSAKGKVRVHLAIGEQQADGRGRLSRALGAGVWRGVGSSGSCSGRWSAERRN